VHACPCGGQVKGLGRGTFLTHTFRVYPRVRQRAPSTSVMTPRPMSPRPFHATDKQPTPSGDGRAPPPAGLTGSGNGWGWAARGPVPWGGRVGTGGGACGWKLSATKRVRGLPVDGSSTTVHVAAARTTCRTTTRGQKHRAGSDAVEEGTCATGVYLCLWGAPGRCE